MRLVIVQFAGDYREAARNFADGKDELYYAQKYSVDSVAKLTAWVEEVTIICCTTQEVYDEVLPSGVRAIGAGFSSRIPARQLIALIEAQRPTHLVADLKLQAVFEWAIKNRVKTLTLFSGSVQTKTLGNKLRAPFLVRALNHPQVEWVGSYGINSSLLLKRLGVKANKIIPWDYILETSPGSLAPKQPRRDNQPWTLFYVGSMIEEKGVGDILNAVATLKARGISVKARLAGRDTGFYAAKIKELGLEDRIELIGLVPNKSVETLMREADLVLIPSRHEYTEGFPLTIHHALKSRTPIVASDHPMFRNKLEHQVSAMVFPASNATAIADCIQKLQAEPDLYFKLSEASYDTWRRLRLPVKWADVLEHWLRDLSEDRQWLLQHQLAAEVYRDRIKH